MRNSGRHCLCPHVTWIRQKEDSMKNKSESIDPIPPTFSSEEEAGQFWDTHSTEDYEDDLQVVDMTIDIEKLHYEIEINEANFLALQDYSKKKTNRSKQSQVEF